MHREYLILTNGENNCGAVKLEISNNTLRAEVDIDGGEALGRGEVFRVYLVCPEAPGEKVRYLGVPEDHKGTYELKSTTAPLGIAVTRKNQQSGKENYLCCCAEQGLLKNVENCFKDHLNGEGKTMFKEKDISNDIAAEEENKNMAEDVQNQQDTVKEAPPKDSIQSNQSEIKFEKEYQRTAEEKLDIMVDGFQSEKINGYFLKGKSKILEYIMGSEEVYRRIMRYGYYILSSKKSENGEMFVISVPSAKKEENPFKGCDKYAFKVESDITEDMGFYSVAAGKDETGEFFCKIT
ncbi:MAG: hypothetical protein Q8873_06000 [Bacillota bacterium]|nr:hypothetical protein [Bacillota bacterium]